VAISRGAGRALAGLALVSPQRVAQHLELGQRPPLHHGRPRSAIDAT
jgi:hypothetical protein